MGEDDQKEQVRQRYAAMSDGELEELAEQGAQLTYGARELLAEELERRELDIEIQQPQGMDVLELRKLVTIRQFRDVPEALIAKGELESAGIESFLGDDNVVRMDWFWSNLMGGVKLRVAPEDAEEADQILKQPLPEKLGEYEMPQCPKCGSRDVALNELNEKVAYTTAWLNLPVPVHDKGWKCKACGARWSED
jgi:hypothetical protein